MRFAWFLIVSRPRRPAAPPAKPPAVAAKPTSSLPAGFFDDEAPAAVVKPTVPVVPRPTPANTKAPSPALPSSKPVLVAVCVAKTDVGSPCSFA